MMNRRCVTLIAELVQFERQKVKDACRDADNVKAKEVRFALSSGLCNDVICFAHVMVS